jgi:hypothetical protein
VALVTSTGEIVKVISGTAKGIIESAKGLGISFMAEKNTIKGKTNHGDYRSKQRGFCDEMINDIKENPSQKVYQSGGRTVYTKKNGNFYDVVIVNKEGKVITTVGGKEKTLDNWKKVTKMLNNNGGYSSLPMD